MTTTKSALILALALLAAPLSYAAELVFENTWIAEAPPVSKVLAAYMDIKNPGNSDVKIVAASSSDFNSIEFHRTIDENGMAKMQQQNELLIPAGGELALQPGGYHMMLFKPARPLPAGERSTFRLKLADGKTVDIVAEVKKAAAAESHEHHHH